MGTADDQLGATDREFGLLRALCATQRQAAELLQRAQATSAEIEATAEVRAEAYLSVVAGERSTIADAFQEVEALLRAEREELAAAIRRIEGQLLTRRRSLHVVVEHTR